MKLSKNFCWTTFQRAVAKRQSSFVTDGYQYDLIYVADGAMITNKRRATAELITEYVTDADYFVAQLDDWTPLHYNKETKNYTPLFRGQTK